MKFTVQVLNDGNPVGMMGVHGTTGQVMFYRWMGMFRSRKSLAKNQSAFFSFLAVGRFLRLTRNGSHLAAVMTRIFLADLDLNFLDLRPVALLCSCFFAPTTYASLYGLCRKASGAAPVYTAYPISAKELAKRALHLVRRNVNLPGSVFGFRQNSSA